jgi:cell wall-associated NlpC family hydrolase
VSRHSWTGRITVACVTLLVVSVGAAPGQAAPSRDIRQVQAQVRDLQMKAASAREDYYAAQSKLNDTQQRLSGIRNKVKRERDDLAVATASINDLARNVYMSGGMDTTLQVLLAENPSDFLGQSAALDMVAQSQAAGLRRTKTAQVRLAQSEATLADQEGIAQGLRDDMEAAKQDADGNLADAQAVLASLQEQERQRLAALLAQQARDSAAAAQQALAAVSVASSAGGGFSGGSRAAVAVQYALSQVGKPYSYSASPPYSWDCSKLTAAAWAQAGVGITPLSYSQFSQVRRISDSELQPGDLVFYFGGGAHHVAMYIGGGKMVSASNPSDGVEVIDYKGPWYGERYSGAGRVLG